ncbi:scavenger receptor cysteine-rich type 1 protein M130-like [Pholidichthys leucotaenia]
MKVSTWSTTCEPAAALTWPCGPLMPCGVQAEGKPNLTEPVMLVGGDSGCGGIVEVEHLGEWRPVERGDFSLKTAAVVCEHLDCGSAVSVGKRKESSERDVWQIYPDCVQSGSSLRDCITPSWSSSSLQTVTCSDSVRLLNGTSVCSGRLEVKSNQSWSSVCQADFDQQDAEVVCRELGCGSPLLLRGTIYGDAEASVGTKEFQCGGNESALLDCRRSGSARKSCSPGEAVGLTCSGRRGEPVRLVGGDSRCGGTVEVKHLGEWRPVGGDGWTLKTAAVVCEHLDCGSAVSVGKRKESSERDVWQIYPDCVQSGSSLRDCITSSWSSSSLQTVTCSDSVRLLNGTSVCSGRLEVKSNQSWSSVCQADFDQQDAEVVCRELGCGPPSLLRGALYGDVEAPVGTKEFQCGGNESALLDCRSSGSARKSCSPGEAVGLTCSEPVRLVRGDSRCGGTVEVKHLGEWRPVGGDGWTLKTAAVVCEHLDCGSAVSVGERKESSGRDVWRIYYDCVQSGSSLRDCVTPSWSSSSLQTVTCSDSVRLLNGTSSCSGRLEVKSNQSWSSVCQADFDQQDAEVVCRELGCGPPSLLRGALYGEVEAPVGTKEFQCGGNESALLDCRSSGSARKGCSPGEAVGLTCSEPVRLVRGDSRCGGTVEVKYLEEWRPVGGDVWPLKTAAVVCEHLDCGSAVSVGEREESSERDVWWINPDCVQSGSSLRDCGTPWSSSSLQTVTCSGSTELLCLDDSLPSTVLRIPDYLVPEPPVRRKKRNPCWKKHPASLTTALPPRPELWSALPPEELEERIQVLLAETGLLLEVKPCLLPELAERLEEYSLRRSELQPDEEHAPTTEMTADVIDPQGFRRERGVLMERCVVDQSLLCSVWILSERLCNTIIVLFLPPDCHLFR